MSWPFPRARSSQLIQALFRVSLRGVGFRCVGLAQKMFAGCQSASNTGFTTFSLFVFFSLSCIITHERFFYFLSAFPQIWKQAIKIHLKRCLHAAKVQATRVFLLFLYLYFFSLSCIITHERFFYFLSAFPQIWKQAIKIQF